MTFVKKYLNNSLIKFRVFFKRFSPEIIIDAYYTLKFRLGFLISDGKKVGYSNYDIYESVLAKTIEHSNQNSGNVRLLNSNLSLLVGFFENLTSPIKVLDFGGGSGLAFYEINRLFPGLISEWSVVETELLVKMAKNTENEMLRFHPSIKSATKHNRYDLVFASSSIPYTSNPLDTLQQLIDIQAKNIIITRNALSKKPIAQNFLQISDLKSNGPGGTVKIKNKFVAYPIVISSIKDFESKILEKYNIVSISSQGYIKYWTPHKNYRYESFEYLLRRREIS